MKGRLLEKGFLGHYTILPGIGGIPILKLLA